MPLVDPVPSSVWDALLRDLLSDIPVLGDLFNLVEAFEALRTRKYLAAAVYLTAFLPGPALPGTHMLVYRLYHEE